jgi:hypothetical protein
MSRSVEFIWIWRQSGAKWRSRSRRVKGAAAAHEQADSYDGDRLMLQVMPLSELVLFTLLVMALLILAVVLYPA